MPWYLANKEKFSIKKKKNTYNLIVINENLLSNKNQIVDKVKKSQLFISQ